jgi:type VI secretion system protein ImpB
MVNKVFNNAQKFIGRNRAPRVQIEYDVEIYGSERKIELPFVMAVLSDLSGKPAEPLPPAADRKFLDIDIDNFDERMKAIKPRVAFSVPNTLTGEGYLMVDVTFESMDDFSPAAVAKKVDALNQLLEARTQLFNLQTYMDGKSGAEDLINQLLQDSALMKALASAPKQRVAVPAAPLTGEAETAASTPIE